MVHIFSNQNIASGSNLIVNFDTELFDVLNEFDTTTFGFTARDSGYYWVIVSLCYNTATWTANSLLYAVLQVDGVTTNSVFRHVSTDQTEISYAPVRINAVVKMAAGQVLKACTLQGTGSSQIILASSNHSYFSIARVA